MPGDVSLNSSSACLFDRSSHGQRELWNAEAERYAASPTADFGSDGFLKILDASGVLTPQARVLDLGCGPGIYSVAIAARVREVLGADVSEEMLRHARKRALEENRLNCSFSVVDWPRADLDKTHWRKAFDLAVARLTPAINTPEDMDKLLDCARKAVFMEQFVRRSHPWMHLAFDIAAAGTPWNDERVETIIGHLRQTGMDLVVHERTAQWGASNRPWEQVADFCLRRLALKMPVSEELARSIRSEFQRRSSNGVLDARETLTLVTVQCMLE